MKLKVISAGLLAAALAGCSSPSNDYNKRPGFIDVPVPPTQGTQIGYLSLHVSGFNENGTTTRADVRISPGGRGKPKGNRTPVIVVDPQLTSRVALSLRDGRDSKAAFAFAQQIARATYCPSGPITENSGIRKISNPQDLQKILAESQRQGRDVIPVGIKGEAIPATHFRTDGTPTWVVSMKCNAPFPYD
ncbi:hypothetical protein [Ruegeria sp.]|uniref:hypothetical protein n=1 Tax=Ruegeria sp. TaxID=1879320 RepID=UPI00231AF652|nr:hypothetical protein [Ruegeria sp.]MDA7966816.1 hypothetical protein [Ruegeria sp.]